MVEPSGEVRPCCRFQEAEPGWNASNQIDEILNSRGLQTTRQNMQVGRVVAGCRNCHSEEALAIPSMRQRAFHTPHLDTTDQVYLTSMEIAVGRVCNLKCRTCDARYSTKWEQDEVALGHVIQHKTHDWLENFEVRLTDFAHLRALKITGGEPVLARSLPKFLKQLIELGLAKQIELQFYTNATVVPSSDLLHLLEQFRAVHLYLSVDGYGAVNEYLRHPSKWPAMQDVMAQWLRWQSANPHVRSSLAHTLSVVNLLSFAEFLEWRESLTPKPGLTLQIVHWPQPLSLTYLNPQLQQALRSSFNAKMRLFQGRDAAAERALSTVERLLGTPARKSTSVDDFFNEVGKLDRLRGENFSTSFPELNAILQDEL